MADKIDVGIIALEPTEKDLEAISHILNENFMETPNIVFHVYKNRRSQYKGVRLWAKADLGTCRIQDLFVTDTKYELIPMSSTIIRTQREQEKKEEKIEKKESTPSSKI
jgi:hypothetical protein